MVQRRTPPVARKRSAVGDVRLGPKVNPRLMALSGLMPSTLLLPSGLERRPPLPSSNLAFSAAAIAPKNFTLSSGDRLKFNSCPSCWNTVSSCLTRLRGCMVNPCKGLQHATVVRPPRPSTCATLWTCRFPRRLRSPAWTCRQYAWLASGRDPPPPGAPLSRVTAWVPPTHGSSQTTRARRDAGPSAVPDEGRPPEAFPASLPRSVVSGARGRPAPP
jgi:hypothetical protein